MLHKLSPASSRRLLTLPGLLSAYPQLAPLLQPPSTTPTQPAQTLIASGQQTTIQERYTSLIQHFSRGNKSAFARLAGISNQVVEGVVGSRQSSPSFEQVQQILKALPQVSPAWLVVGHGPMLLTPPAATA